MSLLKNLYRKKIERIEKAAIVEYLQGEDPRNQINRAAERLAFEFLQEEYVSSKKIEEMARALAREFFPNELSERKIEEVTEAVAEALAYSLLDSMFETQSPRKEGAHENR